MKREEYIKIRNQNPFLLIYAKYTKGFDSKKHKPLLTPEQLQVFLPMYMDVNRLLHDIIQENDTKFAVTQIFNKEEQLIKVI